MGDNYNMHSRKYFDDGLTVNRLIEQLQKLDGDMKVKIYDMMNGQCTVQHIDVMSQRNFYWEAPYPKFVSLW